ncbi:MAG: hypothetical protein FWC68_04760 [Oscillospiraceae bacterium]|nr:hypothetical protein [Oscillospiraceae bacterium]
MIVIVVRNAWYSDERQIKDYYIDIRKLYNRLENKDIYRVNLNGNFGTSNKNYLMDLYSKGYSVIPSIDNLNDLDKLPVSNKYLLKPKESYCGVGIVEVSKNELNSKVNDEYIIQPVMSFIAEIQFYFIGTQFQYALEFKPSKVPVCPEPIEYMCNSNELELARSFANLNNQLIGVQRVDFIKLEGGELLLSEIEDTTPRLDLKVVSKNIRKQFLYNYKNMVYNYAKNK